MIVLRDVLFAPSAVCNIYSLDSSHEYSVEMSFMQKSGTLKDQDGNRVGLIEILRLPRLRLHGQRGGVSSLNPDTMYPINAHWPHSERLRWNAHYGEQLSIAEVPKNGDAPYSTAERAWLKEHYGGEFNFLKTHEMTIHNEEDRAAGRFLVRRKFMQDCGDPKRNSDHMNKDEDEFDSARYLQDMEDEPMSHLADYNFSNTELKWIRTHYGHSYNFMMSHGLKPFDQEDCDEAKSIIKAIMAD